MRKKTRIIWLVCGMLLAVFGLRNAALGTVLTFEIFDTNEPNAPVLIADNTIVSTFWVGRGQYDAYGSYVDGGVSSTTSQNTLYWPLPSGPFTPCRFDYREDGEGWTFNINAFPSNHEVTQPGKPRYWGIGYTGLSDVVYLAKDLAHMDFVFEPDEGYAVVLKDFKFTSFGTFPAQIKYKILEVGVNNGGVNVDFNDLVSEVIVDANISQASTIDLGNFTTDKLISLRIDPGSLDAGIDDIRFAQIVSPRKLLGIYLHDEIESPMGSVWSNNFPYKGAKSGTLAGPDTDPNKLLNQPSISTDTPFAYAGNHSLSFDGNDWYQINAGGDKAWWFSWTDDPNYTPTNFTIAMWVKPSSGVNGVAATLLEKGSGTGDYRLAKDANDEYGFNFNSSKRLSLGQLPQDTWSHVAVIMTGNIIKGYVDGVNVNDVNVAGQVPGSFNSPYIVGWGPSGETWKGLIDELLIASKELPLSETGYNATLFNPTGGRLGIYLHDTIDTSNPDWSLTPPDVGDQNGIFAGPNSDPNKVASQPGLSSDTPFAYVGNQSLSFDGNDWYQINTGYWLNWWFSSLGHYSPTDFTISAWIKASSSMNGLSATFLEKGSGTSVYRLSKDPNEEYSFSLNSGSSLTLATISANTWTHLAVVRSGDNIRGYVNGNKVNVMNVGGRTIGSLASPWVIGWGPAGQGWNGLIDELQFADGALPSSRLGFANSLKGPGDCLEVAERGFSFLGDMNQDCLVDFVDFSIFAVEWGTACNNPTDANCVPNW